jgi:hypothetical protein
MPVMVRRPVAPRYPVTRAVNVAKLGAPNPARAICNTSSSPAGTVTGGSIGESSSVDYKTRRCFRYLSG